ncbi:MAG: hypothetical protein RR942_02970 [Romboutsia sp.]
MTEDNHVQSIENLIKDNNLKICFKDDENYKEIPSILIEKYKSDISVINDYIRISDNIKKLKEYISKYLFDENSSISIESIGNLLLNIKSEENIEILKPFIYLDIENLEEKFKFLLAYFNVSIEEVNLLKEEIKTNYINSSYNEDNILDKLYLDEIIKKSQNSSLYTLIKKSRYGSISKEYNVQDMENIEDYNLDEIGGEYTPILVIYKPAKYVRGEYILDDINYVYIKRQPLNALIKQENLNEKGRDGMGAIRYVKLKHDLTNENLQEIMAELYVYGQMNNISFENIRLADITSNKHWLTADRLKKEFKELRYYHKNLTQKVKEIYDSTGAYYTQISGKYIFNTREFLHCYRAYKNKDINVQK